MELHVEGGKAKKFTNRQAALAQMASIVITQRDRKVVAWIALIVGTLVTASGVFGVWLQDRF